MGNPRRMMPNWKFTCTESVRGQPNAQLDIRYNGPDNLFGIGIFREGSNFANLNEGQLSFVSR
jgi:hypothetical protein